MDINSSSTAGWLSKWITARYMAIAGYISKIIMIETSLSYKQVRRLYKEIADEGYLLTNKSRNLRSGATLIYNDTSKIQASLLMTLYYKIGGDEVLESTNIEALNNAFEIYQAIRKEVPGMDVSPWVQLDITDAWCLALELRSGEAMLEKCNKCKCHYFTSINQRTDINCPYC